jgi:hypothetical protein
MCHIVGYKKCMERSPIDQGGKIAEGKEFLNNLETIKSGVSFLEVFQNT